MKPIDLLLRGHDCKHAAAGRNPRAGVDGNRRNRAAGGSPHLNRLAGLCRGDLLIEVGDLGPHGADFGVKLEIRD